MPNEILPTPEDPEPDLPNEAGIEATAESGLEIFYNPGTDATNGIVAMLAARSNLKSGIKAYNRMHADAKDEAHLPDPAEDKLVHLTQQLAVTALFGMNVVAGSVPKESERHGRHRRELATAIIQKSYGIKSIKDGNSYELYYADEEAVSRLLTDNEFLKTLLEKGDESEEKIIRPLRAWLDVYRPPGFKGYSPSDAAKKAVKLPNKLGRFIRRWL